MNELDKLKLFDSQVLLKPDFFISESKKYRSIFLEQIDSEYWLSITNIPELFDFFRKCYFLLSLCPSQDVYDRYDEMLNKRMIYKWNLGAEGFLNKLEEINQENIVYIPINYSFLNWREYLDIQIGVYCRTELLKIIACLKQFDGTADQDFLARLRSGYELGPFFENYFRRREYNAKNKKRFDLLLDETLETISKSVLGVEMKNSLLDSYKSNFMSVLNGEAEHRYLAEIFNVSLLLPGYYKIEKYVVFFDLLKFLLKDKISDQFTFLSKEQFEDQPSSYENNYRKYQESTVKSILGLR